MPFDPALPANNSPVSSAELRSQFTGLSDNLTDAISALSADAVHVSGYTTDYANTARNLDVSVAKLEMVVSNPPTQAEVQAIADKIDELIDALRRP